MQIRFLSDEQIQRVHETSLRVLAEVGMQVPHAEVRARFADAGARVDDGERVRLPPEVTMRLVGMAGRQFTLYGRDPARRAVFGDGARNYNSSAGQASWLDRPGAARRYGTLEDVATAARLGDALNGLTIVGAMADPHELPSAWRCVEVLSTLLRGTTKPVMFWFHDRASARYLVEAMVALRGSEAEAKRLPLCYPLLEPISPLRFPFQGLDLLFETARLNLPVAVGPMAQMGLTAPGTLAGTLVQQNAEVLAGIAATQVVQPGLPVCYGGICHAFDMASTQVIFGGPEQALFGVALTQMGKYYGLPVYVNTGLTDAKRPDAQAGIEAGVTLALTAGAGADIFGHLGICGADQGASPDMLVMQDEIIAYVEQLMRNSEFDDDALGFDEIAAVGPDGSFIDRDHTVAHFRRELWFPRLLDRQFYQAWQDAGATTLETRAQVRLETVFHEHTPEPLPADLARELDRIVSAARRHLGAAPGTI